MPPLRLAIVGLGAVARSIHLPALAQVADVIEVAGGCDSDAAARDAAEGLIPVFETIDAMIEATRPDVVAICTPPGLHLDQARQALDAGCHVFLEKPMVETLADADALIEAADRAGRQVVVNCQFPFMATYQAAKAQIGSADFGDLLFLHAWQTFRRTTQTEDGWRGEMTRRLGFEFGVHVFELIRFFFGQTPSTVTAHVPAIPGEHADVVNMIAFGFADGRAATVVLDRLAKGPHRYLELSLDGTNATIHTSIGGELRVEIGLHAASRRPFAGLHVVRGGQAVLQQGDRQRTLATEGLNPFATATARHLRQFAQAIRAGTEPLVSARDHRDTLALALAVYDAADAGRTLDLAPYLAPPH